VSCSTETANSSAVARMMRRIGVSGVRPYDGDVDEGAAGGEVGGVDDVDVDGVGVGAGREFMRARKAR
jgi:hypothetical protein